MPTGSVTAGSKPAKKKAAAKSAKNKSGNGKAGSDVQDTMVDPGTDQQRLPGQPLKIVKPLVDFAIRHENTKEIHAKATQDLKDQNVDGIGLFEKYKEHFEDDGDGGFIYQTKNVQITVPGKVPTIKTKKLGPVAD